MNHPILANTNESCKQKILARIKLKKDEKNIKSYDIEVRDENKLLLLLTINGFYLSKLQSKASGADLYVSHWIESEYYPSDKIQEISSSVAVVRLRGSVGLDKNHFKAHDYYFINVSYFNALSGDEIPEMILVPVLGVLDASSSLVLEDFLSMVQILSKKDKMNSAVKFGN